MTTITAKELRDNLEQIVTRTRRGEVIQVTYRSKPAFTLQPEQTSVATKPGSQLAMKKFAQSTSNLRKSKKQSVFDTSKSTKELYYEMLDNDSRYNRQDT